MRWLTGSCKGGIVKYLCVVKIHIIIHYNESHNLYHINSVCFLNGRIGGSNA